MTHPDLPPPLETRLYPGTSTRIIAGKACDATGIASSSVITQRRYCEAALFVSGDVG
jgi:hypothetical protein